MIYMDIKRLIIYINHLKEVCLKTFIIFVPPIGFACINLAIRSGLFGSRLIQRIKYTQYNHVITVNTEAICHVYSYFVLALREKHLSLFTRFGKLTKSFDFSDLFSLPLLERSSSVCHYMILI